MTPFGSVLSWSSSSSSAAAAVAAAAHAHAHAHSHVLRAAPTSTAPPSMMTPRMVPMHRQLLADRARRRRMAAASSASSAAAAATATATASATAPASVAGVDDVTSASASAATIKAGGSGGAPSLVAARPIGGRNSTGGAGAGKGANGGAPRSNSTSSATATASAEATETPPPPAAAPAAPAPAAPASPPAASEPTEDGDADATDDGIWKGGDDGMDASANGMVDYAYGFGPPPPPLASSPWWVRLTESDGTDPAAVPEGRRAHSSCVYAVGGGRAGTAAAAAASNEGAAAAAAAVGGDGRDGAGTTNTNGGETSNGGGESVQEYMVTSGGFTDLDWSTFPVYAFDLTASSTLAGSGAWVDLTPPPPPSSTLNQCKTSTIRSDAKNDADDMWAYAMDCPPPPRVGHLTVAHGGYLYVFGGLLYDDREGVFYEEEQPFVYRLGLEGKLGTAGGRVGGGVGDGNDGNNDDGNDDGSNPDDGSDRSGATGGGWQRIVPNVSVPPSDDVDDVDPTSSPPRPSTSVGPHDGPNRGEVRGGLWRAQSKVVIHGGLRVRDVPTAAAAATGFGGGVGGGGVVRQVDTPLGDVWSYDLGTDTWERMAPSGGGGGDGEGKGEGGWMMGGGGGGANGAGGGGEAVACPTDRTAHAAAIAGNDLIIFGGMAKIGESPWDGSTLWSDLDDVWIFSLEDRVWRERVVYPSLSRAYHSAVAWEADYGGSGGSGDGGPVLAAFGGYTTVKDPVSEEPITFVFDDTIVSNPPPNGTDMTAWLKASWPSAESDVDSISNRLEHTAVLSDATGEMFVWGGRFEDTRQIEGVWALNVAGPDSTVRYDLAEPDGLDDYEESVAAMHVLLAALMFMSMMFTTMCGVFNRHPDGDGAEEGENGGVAPASGGRRGGLRQNVIDTLPLNTYRAKDPTSEDDHRDLEAGEEGAGSSLPSDNRESESAHTERVTEGPDGHGSTNDAANENNTEDGLVNEDDCCPICLVEYVGGDEIRKLPCDHEFHKSCVDPWLGRNASCPACRHCLRGLSAPPAPGLLSNFSSSSLSFPRSPGLTWSSVFNPTHRNSPNEVTETNNDEVASDDVALHYVSSLELEEESTNVSGNGREETEDTSDSRSHSSRSSSSRRSGRRGRGRGRRTRRMGSRLVPLNDPLQADSNAVLV